MADAPSQVAHGKVIGHFVSFLADTSDVGEQVDEVTLDGKVVLTPGVPLMRWPETVPPRTALLQAMDCPIINGDIYPPGTVASDLPEDSGVTGVSSHQPQAEPNYVPWTASIRLNGAAPLTVVFDMPTNGVIDLTTVVPVPAAPGTVNMVTSADRIATEAARDEAEQLLANVPTVLWDPVSTVGLPDGTLIAREAL